MLLELGGVTLGAQSMLRIAVQQLGMSALRWAIKWTHAFHKLLAIVAEDVLRELDLAEADVLRASDRLMSTQRTLYIC